MSKYSLITFNAMFFFVYVLFLCVLGFVLCCFVPLKFEILKFFYCGIYSIVIMWESLCLS